MPEVPQVESYRAPAGQVEAIRSQAVATIEDFLDAVARSLRQDGLQVRTMTKGSLPARTIVSVGNEEEADLIMLTSRGRGGWDRVFTGSVAERVVSQSERAVLMVPIHDKVVKEIR